MPLTTHFKIIGQSSLVMPTLPDYNNFSTKMVVIIYLIVCKNIRSIRYLHFTLNHNTILC